VDAGLDENEAELGVFVLAVALEVLADSDGLLDQHVEVLWDFRGQAVALEDSQNLVAGDDLDLCDAVGVAECDTDLRGSGAFAGELADLVHDLVGRRL